MPDVLETSLILEALCAPTTGVQMATYTPPPYFPQSSLAPPDKNRYRKFKLLVFAIGLVILLLVVGIAWGLWHFLKTAL